MPDLPLLSDPGLFIEFHDGALLDTKYQRPYGTARFKALSKRGDAELTVHYINTLYRYFGEENIPLFSFILDKTKSNVSQKHLSISYELNRYLAIPISQNEKKPGKFWADAWEAYWGALFMERRYWHEDMDDLKLCLRTLIYLENAASIRLYGLDPFFTSDPPQGFQCVVPSNDIDIKVIRKGDICGTLSAANCPPSPHPITETAHSASNADYHAPTDNPPEENFAQLAGPVDVGEVRNHPIPTGFEKDGDDILGYVASTKPTSNFHRENVSIFSSVDPRLQLSLYCSASWSSPPLCIHEADSFPRRSLFQHDPASRVCPGSRGVSASRIYFRKAKIGLHESPGPFLRRRPQNALRISQIVTKTILGEKGIGKA